MSKPSFGGNMSKNQLGNFNNMTNVALHKPVQLSSIFEAQNPQSHTDGSAATDGNYDPNKNRMGGFGTMPSINPWALLDLEKIYEVNEIRLFHRDGFFERTKHIRIEASIDGRHFEFIEDLNNLEFEKKSTNQNKQGYVFVKEVMLDSFAARYLKFTLVTNKRRFFHLNQIEVFGSEVIQPDKKEYIESIIGSYNPEFEYENPEDLTSLEVAKRRLKETSQSMTRRIGGVSDLSPYPLNWLSSKRRWGVHALSIYPRLEENVVSVVITTYNRLDKLKTAIASFLNTRHVLFEFIIVDDGSTDGTIDFLKSLKSTDYVNFVVILRQQTGYRENKLAGVLASTGDYLIVFDDDDFVINDIYIDRAIREMKRTGVGVVTHRVAAYNFHTNRLVLDRAIISGTYSTSQLVGDKYTFYGVAQAHIFDAVKFRANIPQGLTRLDDEQITYIGLLSGSARRFADYSIVYRRQPNSLATQMSWDNHFKYNAEDFSKILSDMLDRNLIMNSQYFMFFFDAVLGYWGSELSRKEALEFLESKNIITPERS
jgi:glycosyltransferase involved in cell wall biosynthesis